MKFLVTAASKHGATDEIADAIAARLRDHSIEAERQEPENVATLEGFDGVVLGSAVYMGHWLEPATDLVERHAEALRELPVWAFSSGPVAGKPAVGPELPPGLTYRSHCVFAGKLELSRLKRTERVIAKVVRSRDGDYRNWDAVREWADTIAASG